MNWRKYIQKNECEPNGHKYRKWVKVGENGGKSIFLKENELKPGDTAECFMCGDILTKSRNTSIIRVKQTQ